LVLQPGSRQIRPDPKERDGRSLPDSDVPRTARSATLLKTKGRPAVFRCGLHK